MNKLKAKWITVIDKFTCDKCKSMNGKIMSIRKIKKLMPLHYDDKWNRGCRCTWILVND